MAVGRSRWTTSTTLGQPTWRPSRDCWRWSVPGGSSRPAHTSAPAGSLAAILQAVGGSAGAQLARCETDVVYGAQTCLGVGAGIGAKAFAWLPLAGSSSRWRDSSSGVLLLVDPKGQREAVPALLTRTREAGGRGLRLRTAVKSRVVLPERRRSFPPVLKTQPGRARITDASPKQVGVSHLGDAYLGDKRGLPGRIAVMASDSASSVPTLATALGGRPARQAPCIRVMQARRAVGELHEHATASSDDRCVFW